MQLRGKLKWSFSAEKGKFSLFDSAFMLNGKAVISLCRHGG